MEEKILIKSKQYDIKKAVIALAIIGVIISAILTTNTYNDWYDRYYNRYLEHHEDGDCGLQYSSWEKCYICERVNNGTLSQYVWESDMIERGESYYSLIPAILFIIISGFIYLWLRSYELTVTDKRVYGKVYWGKRVDLPVDSISAIGTLRLSKGISVSTASGRISFLYIKNSDEIYNVLNNLLIERQTTKVDANTTADNSQINELDQLKKLKELLDSGILTQEEFEAKKKQLLGL